MTVKLGFLVAASVVAFTVKHICSKFTRPPNSLSKIIGEDVSAYHEEISFEKQDEKKEGNFADSSIASREEKKEGVKKANHLIIDIDVIDAEEASATKLERLRGLIREMQERQVKLEAQLLQCYNLENQNLKVAKLKKQIKIKTIESKKLNLNINLLITDHNKLQEENEQVDLEKKQLENAMCRIKELQRKIEDNTKAKEQLQFIENQVSVFQTADESKRDASVCQALKPKHHLELEAMELKRRNKEIQLEKRILAIKLFAAQARLTFISNTSESGIISDLQTEAGKLRLTNEELVAEVETLQKSRFMMIDEFVYMRWINACLHHELQIHQTSETKNSSSKTKILAKQIMLDEASIPHQKEETKSDEDSLSSILSLDDSRHRNATSTDDSAHEEPCVSKKSDLVEQLKRRRRSSADSSTLLTSESSTSRSSSLSSTNISCGSSIPSSPEDVMDLKKMEVQNPITSSDTSNLKLRKRRVSFSDSVHSLKSTYPKLSMPKNGIADNNCPAFEDQKKMAALKATDRPNTNNKAEHKCKDTSITSSDSKQLVIKTRGVVGKGKLLNDNENSRSEDADDYVARNTEFHKIQESSTSQQLHITPENGSTEVHNKDLNVILIVILFLFILLYYFLLHKFHK